MVKLIASLIASAIMFLSVPTNQFQGQDATTTFTTVKEISNQELSSAISQSFDDVTAVETVSVVKNEDSGAYFYAVTAKNGDEAVAFKISMSEEDAMAEKAPECGCEATGNNWKVDNDIRSCTDSCS
ncbi:MAG: hypothetical protein H6570_16250 [Lewinellaceae bacterium]|nr:hypothetical protein [Lewinellaceae bacterium]